MKRGDGESTRCLCLGTVTPMLGDVLGDSISPSTYSSCMTALGSMQGGPGKGCSALCHGLCPPPAPAARQGQAGQAAVRHRLLLPFFHPQPVQQRSSQQPGQLFSQPERKRLKSPCLADVSGREIKNSLRRAFIPAALRREASPALQGSHHGPHGAAAVSPPGPGHPCTGEVDFSLAVWKLFLVEVSPKHEEFWPRGVYFLCFHRLHLWFRGIQAQKKK